MVQVAVGVVVFNTKREDLYDLLSSAVEQSDATDVEIQLLVKANDGRSYDEDLEYARQKLLRSCKITLLSGEENCGFGAGHNKLITAAKGEGATYYVGCNPDGRLHHRAIGQFVREAERREKPTLFEFLQFPEEHPKTYDFFDGATSWVAGACFAARVDLLDALKFDENIRMYCEDVDLSWRVVAEGGDCVVLPKCLFFHDVTDRRDRYTVRMEMLKSGRYLAWKWRNEVFQQSMEDELVRLGVADAKTTLPVMVGEQVQYPQETIERVTEFSRAFSFSSVRW
jgi:GT2 family glycosyltransferase